MRRDTQGVDTEDVMSDQIGMGSDARPGSAATAPPIGSEAVNEHLVGLDWREFRPTSRGFSRGDFRDLYGSECSIQESSLADPQCIWLGQNNSEVHHVTGEPLGCRMHLTRGMAAELAAILAHFACTGDLVREAPPISAPQKLANVVHCGGSYVTGNSNKGCYCTIWPKRSLEATPEDADWGYLQEFHAEATTVEEAVSQAYSQFIESEARTLSEPHTQTPPETDIETFPQDKPQGSSEGKQ